MNARNARPSTISSQTWIASVGPLRRDEQIATTRPSDGSRTSSDRRARRGASGARRPLAPLGERRRARSCSARISAARSSSRTASSASIASCFISGATSCPENLAHENSAVKREVARRLTSRSAKIRCEVLVRRLGRVARQPVGGERPLHAGVGGDHGAARIRLGPQVVERLVEHVGQRGQERIRHAARAGGGGRGGRGTSATTAIATRARTTRTGPVANCGLVARLRPVPPAVPPLGSSSARSGRRSAGGVASSAESQRTNEREHEKPNASMIVERHQRAPAGRGSRARSRRVLAEERGCRPTCRRPTTISSRKRLIRTSTSRSAGRRAPPAARRAPSRSRRSRRRRAAARGRRGRAAASSVACLPPRYAPSSCETSSARGVLAAARR